MTSHNIHNPQSIPSLRSSSLSRKLRRKGEEGDFACVDFVLAAITRLPTKTEKNVLTIEQDMLRHRFMSFVSYLFTRGYGGHEFSSSQQEALQLIETKLQGKKPYL